MNKAGVVGPALTPIADVEEDRWDELMDTDLRPVFVCMKLEIPAMLRTGGGTAVNLSSIYGLTASDIGQAAYSAGKHAVIGLTKSGAIDYAGQGIRVNAVAPGFVRSEIVDFYIQEARALVDQLVVRHSAMNRVGDGHEVVATVAWLCSNVSSFVNGAVVTIDDGAATCLY